MYLANCLHQTIDTYAFKYLTVITRVIFRDPKRINWQSHRDSLRGNLGTLSRSICMIRYTDLAVDQLQQTIILSYRNMSSQDHLLTKESTSVK
jgi:hypothetical protein